ncbi:hypothetical protein BWQ96_09379 [Gracilariopsis chorda]|uniref:Uncharacterized protein n=1 Tax=Gracilariopsis chorda TaxID=448386 RepID=A0A2V3IFM0_9FLOR|nr:hypothetical protein BWQ96_09379 [Gracilariopsis chorda]|eukprot:PXF40886.1 hypothetical protein BWQ96_09379 [Gracilariopsis chorda]
MDSFALPTSQRNPSRDLTLLNLLSTDDSSVKDCFIPEFSRLSGCDHESARYLLKDPCEVFLCYLHLNHSRYAQKTAMRKLNELNGVFDPCAFRKRGCSSPDYISESRSWKIPFVDVQSPRTLEMFSELDDAVSYHSHGRLHAADVMGKFCCRSCHHILMEGKQVVRPAISLQTLSSHTDLFVVRSMLFSLANPAQANRSPLLNETLPAALSGVAVRMRDSCIRSRLGGVDGVRMLRFQDVFRSRKVVISQIRDTTDVQQNIDGRTFEKRIEPVLAGQGIILKKLSYLLRCYVRVDQVDEILSQVAAPGPSLLCASPRPSLNDMWASLDIVRAHFVAKKDAYWKGEWSLSDEVASVPKSLWIDVILQMASQRRLLAWNAAARIQGKQLEHIFPACNSIDALPKPTIEEELCNCTSYSRADLLLYVRALKIVEQLVLARTNGTPGPLTVSVSVSGICEVTLSFVSVLNSMGFFLSYTVTERYRQNLIAKRESQGPWDFNLLDEVAIPVLQFDNWDIKPLHSVKVDGKALPKVNGSLLQGQLRGKKRTFFDEESPPFKRRRNGSWKDPACLGNRDKFMDTLTDVNNTTTLQQFNNAVFGLVSLLRGRLVGGKNSNASEYNVGTTSEFNFGLEDTPVNFRTLLLSSFKPHGGRPLTDESLYDQTVVYVQINRDRAADILTVRRFLNLIEEQLRPGQSGCPRYVVLDGDQPSHKMFVKL